jgi:hypothetical protein
VLFTAALAAACVANASLKVPTFSDFFHFLVVLHLAELKRVFALCFVAVCQKSEAFDC